MPYQYRNGITYKKNYELQYLTYYFHTKGTQLYRKEKDHVNLHRPHSIILVSINYGSMCKDGYAPWSPDDDDVRHSNDANDSTTSRSNKTYKNNTEDLYIQNKNVQIS